MTQLRTLALCLFLLPSIVSARDAVTTKLYGRGLTDQDSNAFGHSVAISDQFILIGEPGHDDIASDGGAVQVFNAGTGSYLRTLLPDEATAEDAGFGTSVAICGNRALVGAPGSESSLGALYLFDLRNGRLLKRWVADDGIAGDELGSGVALNDTFGIASSPMADSGQGAVYLFDLATGDQLLRITATDGAAGDTFGSALALGGALLLVGADGDESGRGAAYLFDVSTGVQLLKIRATDGAAGDHFGRSLTLSGNLALVGAPDDNGAGAAYLYRIRTGVQLSKLTPIGLAVGDQFGASVGLDANLAIIGATGNSVRGTQAGAIHLFGASSGSELRTLNAVDASGFEHFGESLAICGNRVVVGAIDDGDLGPGSGSAYVFRPLAGPSPLVTIAQVSDFAPGTLATDFRRFFGPVINPAGDVTFCGQLMGPGSNRGRDKGIWSATPSGSLSIATRSRTPTPVFGAGIVIRTVLPPVSENAAQSLLPAYLAGPGINGRNQLALLGDDGSGLLPLLRTGDPIASMNDAEVLRFQEILQSRDPEAARATIPYQLRPGSGTVRVTPRNDTGVLVVASDGSIVDIDAREGAAALDGLQHAQFFGRAATNSTDFMAYGSYVRPVGPGRALQESFSASTIGAQAASIARQGEDAPGLETGQQFRTLLSEAVGSSSFGLVRALVRGPGINGRNNEGLWRENVDRPLIRRGDEIQPGVFVRRLIRFWPVRDQEVAVQALLRGPGINGRNDGALILVQRDPGIPIPGVNPYTPLILLREGDSVPAADCPRMGVIQRVEVDPESGFYAVTASLTGSPAKNQALFVGNTSLGNTTTRQALRLPWLAMRKGSLFDVRASSTSRLRSILLEPRLDRRGVGGKGLGQVLNPSGRLVGCLQFDDTGKELAVGLP